MSSGDWIYFDQRNLTVIGMAAQEGEKFAGRLGTHGRQDRWIPGEGCVSPLSAVKVYSARAVSLPIAHLTKYLRPKMINPVFVQRCAA